MARINCNHFLLVTGLGFGLLSVLSSAAADPLPCRDATHEGSRYTLCEVDLRRQAVRLFWKKADYCRRLRARQLKRLCASTPALPYLAREC